MGFERIKTSGGVSHAYENHRKSMKALAMELPGDEAAIRCVIREDLL